MQPGPFSFHHYCPVHGWTRLFESRDFAFRVTCTVLLLAFVFLHVIIVHVAYVVVEMNPKFAQVVSGNKTADTPKHLHVNNTTGVSTGFLRRNRESHSRSVFKVVIVSYDGGERNLFDTSLERCSRWFRWDDPLQSVPGASCQRREDNERMVCKGYDVKGMKPDVRDETVHSQAVTSILDMLNCNMKSLRNNTANYRVSTWSKLRLNDYNRCVQQSRYAHTMTAVGKCLPLLTKACLMSNIRYMETFDLSLNAISRILSRDPDVFVIHLVRDPRSLLQPRGVPADRREAALSLTCEMMRQDIKGFRAVRQQHPLRVIEARCEDLVRQPFRSIRRVFHFFDLPCDVNEEDFGRQFDATPVQARATHAVSLQADWHRKSPSLSDIEGDVRQCRDVLSYFGYGLE